MASPPPPPRQSKKFQLLPKGFSPGILKSNFPLHRPLSREFSFRIFAKSLDLTTSNYDERAWINLNSCLIPPLLEKIFNVWIAKKMLWIIKNQTPLPPRMKSENSNSSPKPLLPRHFEYWLPPPPDITLWKILIFPKNVWEKWHYEGANDFNQVKPKGFQTSKISNLLFSH